MATTPRRRKASGMVSSLLSAPRSLNEAVNCRFSNLRNTSAPVRRDSVRLWSIGVRSIALAMRAAAACTSAGVTAGVGSPRAALLPRRCDAELVYRSGSLQLVGQAGDGRAIGGAKRHAVVALAGPGPSGKQGWGAGSGGHG